MKKELKTKLIMKMESDSMCKLSKMSLANLHLQMVEEMDISKKNIKTEFRKETIKMDILMVSGHLITMIVDIKKESIKRD